MRLDGVFGDVVALEVVRAGAVHLRHCERSESRVLGDAKKWRFSVEKEKSSISVVHGRRNWTDFGFLTVL